MSTTEIYFHEKAKKEYLEFNSNIRQKFEVILELIVSRKEIQSNKFKKLKNFDIYELWVKDGDGIYRVFGTFSESRFILLFCYRKKTQKIPGHLIDLILKRYRSIQ